MKICFFDTQLEKIIQSLDKPTVAKVLRTIDLLETFGHKLTPPHSKKIHIQLFELRIRGKQEVRIFYTFHKNKAVLLHGFIKKSKKIPKKELQLTLQKLKMLAPAHFVSSHQF